MPATFTPSGTFTALATDMTPHLAPVDKNTYGVNQNVPLAISINPADLRTVPEEVFQIVELFQNGYAVSNRKVNFWPMAALLRAWFNALFDSQTSQTPTSLAGQVRA